MGSRAGGLHARTLEILDQRGVADRFLSAGYTAQVAGFAQIRLDISDLPTRHPYGLALWQSNIERILAQWVEELGVPIRRGLEATGLGQDDDRVLVRLADGAAVAGCYVVGCDGGRSVVRKSAGIAFEGSGAHHELSDRRGRGDRRAAVGCPARRSRDPWTEPAGRRAGAGHGDRA